MSAEALLGNAEDVSLAAALDAASPARKYPRVGLLLGIVTAIPAAVLLSPLVNQPLAGWITAGFAIGIVVLALLLWPCSRHRVNPLLKQMASPSAPAGRWEFEEDEWTAYAAAELGPGGSERAVEKCFACGAVFCLSPLLALLSAALVIDHDSDDTFGHAFLECLPVAAGMMVFLSIARYVNVLLKYRASQHGAAANPLVVWRNGVLFLGRLLLFVPCGAPPAAGSVWTGGSISLRSLELDSKEDGRRMLSFVLVVNKGKQRGDLRHHAVPIPRAVATQEVQELAARLNAPLKYRDRKRGDRSSKTIAV